MVAVDTNILVRLLTGDDPVQFQASLGLFAKHEVHIPDTVILETEWVLRHAYEFEPVAICTALRKLCGLSNVRLNNPRPLAQALDWHENGLDFADAFHLALSQHTTAMKTLDDRYIRRARKLTPCVVERP